jgi:hypothetical protein
VPDIHYYQARGKYTIEYLRCIENNPQKIESFYKYVIPSLAYPVYFKFENKTKYVCIFSPCKNVNKSFSQKQSYIRHVLSIHYDEMPGGGAFLMPRATSFKCYKCQQKFKNHKIFLLHIQNCKGNEYLVDLDDDEDDIERKNSTSSLSSNSSMNSSKSSKLTPNYSIKGASYIKQSHSNACCSTTGTCSKISITPLNSKKNISEQSNENLSIKSNTKSSSISSLISNDCVSSKNDKEMISGLNNYDTKADESAELKDNYFKDSHGLDNSSILLSSSINDFNNKGSMKRDLSSYSICGPEEKKSREENIDFKHSEISNEFLLHECDFNESSGSNISHESIEINNITDEYQNINDVFINSIEKI